MVVVSVWENVELAEALLPLLGSLGGGGIGKDKGEVEKAGGKDGLASFDVECFVDEGREGTVKVEELLQVGVVVGLLAEGAESASECCADADKVL